jgi:lipoprotein NlpD
MTFLRGFACCGLGLVLAGLGGCLSWAPPAERVVIESSERPPADSLPPVAAGEYRVQPGDTVYSIAFRHAVDFRELAQWNDIRGDFLIHPGQVLRLRPPEVLRPVAPENGDVATAPIPLPPPRLPPQPLPIGGLPGATTPALPTPTPTPTPAPVVAASGAPASVSAQGWQWPTVGIVERNFSPAQGSKGLVLGGREGQPVVAAAAGRVVYSGNALKGYGELIIIKHNEVHLTAYGFNRARLVKEGDTVARGQPIAEMGQGPERKPMLHFEIRERGQPVNPMRFLPPTH